MVEPTWTEQRFRAMMLHSGDIISLLDARGRLLYNSPAAERISGFSTAELVGADTFQFIHPDDKPEVAKAFERVLAAPGEAVTVQYRYRKKAGGWTWMEAVACNRLDDPQVRGVVANSRDISDRKRVEAALEAANAQLRKALADVKTLTGLLPICAWCKRVREDSGYWTQVERFISSRSDASFTHCICPGCADRLEHGR
jgi:PAS domain S-box-containing protein